MTELKPCPFCGGKARGKTDLKEVQDMSMTLVEKSHYVACTECWCQTPRYYAGIEGECDPDKEFSAIMRAVEDWNRRVGE